MSIAVLGPTSVIIQVFGSFAGVWTVPITSNDVGVDFKPLPFMEHRISGLTKLSFQALPRQTA